MYASLQSGRQQLIKVLADFIVIEDIGPALLAGNEIGAYARLKVLFDRIDILVLHPCEM